MHRAELLDSAVQAGYVEGRHDRHARVEPAIADVLEPFVHVNDVDVTSPGPSQGVREVSIDTCPPLPRVFAEVVTEAPRNGPVLLAGDGGIRRAGNDGPVPEGAESFVDVVDDRFDRAISHVGRNRFVGRGHVKDVQSLAGCAHWSCQILTGSGLLPLDLLANLHRILFG
jgi:hypothetical protein